MTTTLAKGTRVRLEHMALEPDGRPDPDPIAVGTTGTITYANREVDLGDGPFNQYSVRWDNGRTLMVCVPPDRISVIARADETAAAAPSPRWDADDKLCAGYGPAPEGNARTGEVAS